MSEEWTRDADGNELETWRIPEKRVPDTPDRPDGTSRPKDPIFCPGSRTWELFHRAWTNAVGQPGYDKAEWLRMERALSEAAKTP